MYEILSALVSWRVETFSGNSVTIWKKKTQKISDNLSDKLLVNWGPDNVNHYDMVGVAVAIVICAMYEKSCIDLHSIRKFEKMFQNSII